MFADNLQVLVQKLIASKPEFRTDANEQLKSQYVHILKDLYYAAIACSMLQSSDHQIVWIVLPGSKGVWQ